MKPYITAHKHCTDNKKALQGDTVCGCFYCLAVFAPTEIKDWIAEGDGTAVCPYCGIDSVIGESAGYPITKEFLSQMRAHWF